MIKNIRIIGLNHTDIFGGAAKSVYRLSESLNNIGIDYKIICNQKTLNNQTITQISTLYNLRDKLIVLIKRIKRKLLFKKENYIEGCSEIKESIIYSTLKRQEFDILHLNWVVGGFVNFKDIAELNKPIIATLHDTSFFTGLCHVIGDCNNYLHKCGKCPKINSNSENDLSRHTFLLKEKRYKNLNLTFVSPSHWMAEMASKSNLTKGRRIEIIPNGINTSKYSPIEKQKAKYLLKLDPNKKYISFGAVYLNDDNKGYHFLKKLLTEYIFDSNIEFICFGKSTEIIESKNKLNNFGYIDNEEILIQIYSASDITLILSKQESFGQTALESISCGTPVVAYKTSGLMDIIDHQINGYLAKPFLLDDVYKGINWCLNQKGMSLSENARKKAITNFDIKTTSQKFKNLINDLIG